MPRTINIEHPEISTGFTSPGAGTSPTLPANTQERENRNLFSNARNASVVNAAFREAPRKLRLFAQTGHHFVGKNGQGVGRCSAWFWVHFGLDSEMTLALSLYETPLTLIQLV